MNVLNRDSAGREKREGYISTLSSTKHSWQFLWVGGHRAIASLCSDVL